MVSINGAVFGAGYNGTKNLVKLGHGPYIFRIKHNGKDKWVAAVGGGYK